MASLEFVYLPKTAINEPFLFTGKEKCPESIIDLSQVQLRLHQRWNTKIFSWLHCCNVKDNEELFVWSFYIDIRTFIFITQRFTQYLSSQIKERIYLTSHWWIIFLRQGDTCLIRLSQGDPRHNTLIQIWELYAYRTHETRFVRFSVP